MPRRARQESSTGIYHAMLRGINQQNIFHDREDNLKFLDVVKEAKTVCNFKLYSYCLMSNHVHLMLKVEENLGQIFKRIGVAYVYWYNLKYKRVGHLFQDRFKSEVVENDEYFLTVLRYIHQNPVKAGMVKDIQAYEYSSYGEYTGQPNIVDTKFVLDIIDLKQFIDFHKIESNENCLEVIDAPYRLNDAEATKIIESLFGCTNMQELQAIDANKRTITLSKLKAKGLSIRQISRLTGFSRGIVERA